MNKFQHKSAVEIQAENLVALSPQGQPLTKPLSFHIPKESHIALVGQKWCRKNLFNQCITRFLSLIEGSLKIKRCGTESKPFKRLAKTNCLGRDKIHYCYKVVSKKIYF